MMLRFFTLATALFLGVSLLAAQAEPLTPPAPVPAGVDPKKAAPVEQKLPEKSKRRITADEFFAGPVISLDIQFTPEQWNKLKASDRNYAECTIVETDADGKTTTYEKVGVKTKGAAGSSQPLDRKPGLTINMDKFDKSQRFHGMDKFHLNNSMQDRTFLNEFISGEISRAVGVPASRCTHVLVKWNGKDNGLYVFKEGFTKDFLSYFYEKNDGSLYDGHFIADVDADLEKQQGDENDRSDLKGLAAAVKETDEKVRWQKIYERLDVDEYLRFLALESILCHWDGYNFTRNNYRIYFDSKTGKASFFAHGMDNLINDSNGPLFRPPTALTGAAVMSNPEWKTHYRTVVETLYKNVLKPTDWDAKIVAQGKRVTDALARRDPKGVAGFEENIRISRERVKARITSIGRQLGEPDPSLVWKDGVLKLQPKEWRSNRGEPQVADVNGEKFFYLRAEARMPLQLLRTVSLQPGRYRLEAEVKTAAVESAVNGGARLNVSGRPPTPGVRGDSEWQKVTCEFDAPGGDSMLIAELNGTSGEAWFKVESMQLVKVQ